MSASIEQEGLKDSGKATKYTINFNHYARKTGWNEQALTCQFYKNLLDQLKDDIAHIRKPQSGSSKQDNRQQQRNKDQQKPTASTSATPDNKPNPIANLLGPNRKLTPEEHKHRLDNKLCLCTCSGYPHVSDGPVRR